MDDIETLHRRARLRELIKECFGDKIANLIRHIEDRTGKQPNQGEMSAILKDNGKSFGDKKAKTLTEQIGLNRRWFDLPTGSLMNKNEWLGEKKKQALDTKGDSVTFRQPEFLEHKNDDVIFNLFDVKAACGLGEVNSEYPEIIRTITMPPGEALRLIGSQNKTGDIRIIVASKDSMTPEIQPDDLLFVDTSIKDYVGEAVYILLHGGELVCKRLSLVGKTLTVSSDNKAYPSWPWEDKPDETSIVGKVLRALPMTFKKFGSI